MLNFIEANLKADSRKNNPQLLPGGGRQSAVTQTGGKHVNMHPLECVGEHIGSGMATVH